VHQPGEAVVSGRTDDLRPGGTPNGSPNTASHDRFLSNEACQALVKRAIALSTGGGETMVQVDSSWTGNLRWARNQVSTAGDVRNNELFIQRDIRGATGVSGINQIDDAHVLTAIRRAERLVHRNSERPESELRQTYIEPYSHPAIWSDATYNLDAPARAAGMRALVQPAIAAGMSAAGYVQVSAHGRSTMDAHRVWYYPYTLAQYSVTVRDPEGRGSGWAGIDANDWSKIDAPALSAIALDKCLRSRNPVAVEPGRYTTILEPQAVCDFVKVLFTPSALDRENAENGDPQGLNESQYNRGLPRSVYNQSRGMSKIGQRLLDERLSVTSDPMDPELGFPPFLGWRVYHPVTWFKDGILRELAYSRAYAVKKLSKDTGGFPATGAFRMHVRGATASIDDMIATTKRGLLVTRFAGISNPLDPVSMMLTGYTRDGLWLIENGKIAKPVKNFRFTESPLFTLNNIEQIGTPRRVFRPDAPDRLPDGYAPVIVPALKVRDFNFTSLSDAV
jgi:predicted Zn-dependent protease